MNKKQKGFTLVEMILVTVIIGILASIVIGVINIPRVQARSRDSKRISDLKLIQNALELYFADRRTYPESLNWQAISPTLLPAAYISTLPSDPRTGSSSVDCFSDSGVDNNGYYYRSRTSGRYILGTIMEVMDTVSEKRSCTTTDTPNCVSAYGYGCKNASGRCYCVQNPL